ncbi:amidohydrolase family protein [Roseomonas nepalensis]|uniref:Amidohydrolase family protein n=1 Tax=Muricoccus nepalensis TaxID=1854500 RepID=A0A502G6W1_9PROT|nr:amidohydrolase family protein [Roseomonas nepalensis]
MARRSLLPLGLAAFAATRPARAETLVALEGAEVFDGERRIGRATILVADDVIRAIGPAASVTVPAGARRVDLAGRVVVPGLISAHSHVGNSGGAETGGRFYTRENVLDQLRQFAAYGVTTVTALGLGPAAFFDIREEVRRGGTGGADLLGAGMGVGVPDGTPPAAPMNLNDSQVARPNTPEEAREAIRMMARRRVDIVKLWVDDLGGTVPMMRPEIIVAATEEAHAQGLRVAAHIHDLEQARIVVQSGVDVVAHGVRDMPVDAALIAAMRQRGTWYIPTIQINEANYLYADRPELLSDPFFARALNAGLRAQFGDPEWRRKALEAAASSRQEVAVNQRNLKALHAAGVRIGFGTDSGATANRIPGFAEHRELELMVEAGLTPEEAMRCATGGSAALLGLEDRGLLRPGRRADLLVLDADPLADIRNVHRVRAVWQRGREVSGAIG